MCASSKWVAWAVPCILLSVSACQTAAPEYQSAYCWAEANGMVLDEKWDRGQIVKCAPLVSPANAVRSSGSEGGGGSFTDGTPYKDRPHRGDHNHESDSNSGSSSSASSGNGSSSSSVSGSGGASSASAGGGSTSATSTTTSSASAASAGNGRTSTATTSGGVASSASSGSTGTSSSVSGPSGSFSASVKDGVVSVSASH